MEGICQAVKGERQLLSSVKLLEMLSPWMCSHSSFSLTALNVGRFIENKWRSDKEPSTMAAGAELTRTAVGQIEHQQLAQSVFILSHDELCSCPSLGQIYVRVYAHLFNCCVYPSAPAAFKEGVMKPISSGNEPTSMKNHLRSSNVPAQWLWCPYTAK